jgi:hypothetical protein
VKRVKLKAEERWVTAEGLDEMFDVSSRHLVRLRKAGLPNRMLNRRRVYPLRDATAWMFAYKRRVDRGERVTWIDLDVAIAELVLAGAEESAARRAQAHPRYDADGCRLIDGDDVLPAIHRPAG